MTLTMWFSDIKPSEVILKEELHQTEFTLVFLIELRGHTCVMKLVRIDSDQTEQAIASTNSHFSTVTKATRPVILGTKPTSISVSAKPTNASPNTNYRAWSRPHPPRRDREYKSAGVGSDAGAIPLGRISPQRHYLGIHPRNAHILDR